MNPPHIRYFRPRFNSGRIFVTPAALELLSAAGVSPIELVLRHISGDWGTLPDGDRQQNELSIETGLRVLTSYALPMGNTVLVITEWDRSATTILLPDEY